MPPKKTKETSACGNPLFLKWLGEWMESAKATNNKIYYTYKKVYYCPISYTLLNDFLLMLYKNTY